MCADTHSADTRSAEAWFYIHPKLGPNLQSDLCTATWSCHLVSGGLCSPLITQCPVSLKSLRKRVFSLSICNVLQYEEAIALAGICRCWKCAPTLTFAWSPLPAGVSKLLCQQERRHPSQLWSWILKCLEVPLTPAPLLKPLWKSCYVVILKGNWKFPLYCLLNEPYNFFLVC